MEAVPRRIALVAAFVAVAAAGCSRTDAGPEAAGPAGTPSTLASTARTPAADSNHDGEPSSSDFAITAKVKAALLADPALDALAIHVDTRDGAVTLSGNVDSNEKKSRATEVATRVPGVQTVVDDLALRAR